MNKYISIGEAAKLLGIHVNTLRNWHKCGLLKPLKTIGGHRRYAMSDINRFFSMSVSLVRETKFKDRKLTGKIIRS